MIKRLQRMLIKEFLQMLRDPRMRVVVFGLPVIQMMIMAFAMTMDVDQIRTAVLDMDKTPSSRELLQAFGAADYFRIVRHVSSQKDFARLLDRSEVEAVLYIPSGFAQALTGGDTAKFQLITDGTNTNTTAIVMNYAEGIAAAFSNQKLKARMAETLGRRRPLVQVETVTRAWFNPNQESRFFYAPSLIAVMLFIFSLLLTSIGIVKEKEIGTIEQVMVTPIRKIEFILGKAVPYMLTGYITMTVMLCIAVLVFGVRIQGSLPLLYALTGIYIIGNIGIALLISASAATQQQALLTSFLIIMPCVMLSGFIFPVKNMPLWVQHATLFNPMRWYLEILRGIIMKGVGMRILWTATLGQALLAVTFITLAAKTFRKTLS